LACLFAGLSPPTTNTKEVQVNGNGEDTVQKATPDLGTLSEKDRTLVRPQTKRINSEFTGEPYLKTENDSSGTIRLNHVGMYAKDPASLAEFYRDVMGCKSLAAVMRVTHSVRLLS
jgi:hypothetical protein